MSSTRKKTTKAKDRPGTRERLLDAGERLFAEFGYHGVSVRDIAHGAETPLGLATYYFGTKEELFRQVVLRRADEHVVGIAASLRAITESAAPAGPTIEQLIHAWFTPMVEKAVRGSPGWRSYMHLIARASSLRQTESFLQPLNERYDPVRSAFVDLAARAMPGTSRETLFWATHFLNAAIISLLMEAGSIDRISEGLCRSSDLEGALQRMAPFFAAGFRQLAAG
jgi:AcrR family transcriptional regulator